jgi:hypothetical protein
MHDCLPRGQEIYLVCVQEVELDTTQRQLHQATHELQSATSRCQEAAAFLDRTM